MTVAIEVAGITDIRRFCLRVLFEIIVSLSVLTFLICSVRFSMDVLRGCNTDCAVFEVLD